MAEWQFLNLFHYRSSSKKKLLMGQNQEETLKTIYSLKDININNIYTKI